MSYQVLARKWRPQQFSDLVGQDHVAATLLGALRTGKLAHALLFTGPRGTGKTSTARILAKSLRCPSAVDFVPCLKCSDCVDISLSRHLDVVEIDGASHNGVDAVRELRETLGYRPSSGTYKIYIIDEVHMLSTSAFNALLKTLEEPPPHVLFILATTEVHKIPATVLSRLQRFDFRRISTSQIAETLAGICQNESLEATPDALWLLARAADGSMRDAQSLLDQVSNYCEQKITVQGVTEALGLTTRALLFEALRALFSYNAKSMLELVEKLLKAGADTKVFAQDMLEMLRHALIIKLAPPETLPRLIDLPATEIEELKSLADSKAEEELHLVFDMLLKGIGDLWRATEPRLVLEMVLLRMVHAPRIVDLSRLTQATSSAQAMAAVPNSQNAGLQNAGPQSAGPQTAGSGASATASTNRSKVAGVQKPAPAKATGTGPVASAAPESPPVPRNMNWQQFVDRLKTLQPVMGAKLENCVLLDRKEKAWVIGVPPQVKFLLSQLNEPEFLRRLTSYANTLMGEGHQFQVQMAGEEHHELAPRTAEIKKAEQAREELRRRVEEHPLVQNIQKTFQAEIKSIQDLKS